MPCERNSYRVPHMKKSMRALQKNYALDLDLTSRRQKPPSNPSPTILVQMITFLTHAKKCKTVNLRDQDQNKRKDTKPCFFHVLFSFISPSFNFTSLREQQRHIFYFIFDAASILFVSSSSFLTRRKSYSIYSSQFIPRIVL